MMNSSIVNTNSDISVNNTGINRVNRDNTIYHHNEQRDHDIQRDMSSSPDNNFNCHSISQESMVAVNAQSQPSCSASAEEPRAKKRRKQSNPVRYGQTNHQTPILSIELDEPVDEEADDDDESLVAAGLRVSAELQRSNSFSSSDILDDCADDEDDDDRPLELDRRKLIPQTITNVINFHNHKYQHYCPHCSCPFTNDDELRNHIEEEHVQKLLERQLFQHHHHQQLNHKSVLNGPTGHLSGHVRPSNELSICKFEQSQHKYNSSCSPSGSTSSESNNDTPLESPSDVTHHDTRKSFDTNLPHGSSDETAKEFSSNFLPFQLPNMPPLIPLSQSGGTAMSADGNKCSVPSTSPNSGPISLAMFPNPMAPFLFPIMPGHNNSGSNGSAMANGGHAVSAGGVRIFNPEAYCELCNKEFCNKYFLKTHKANKHGIYSMDTLVGTPGYGAPFFPAGLSNNPNNSSAAAAAIHMQHLLQTSGGMPPTSEAMATAAHIRTGIINMESYCEICQKEFCNKYFLKKHKQKIHGIVDPNFQHNSQQSSSASPGSCSNEPQNKGNSNSPSCSPFGTTIPTTACITIPSIASSMALVPVSTPVITTASNSSVQTQSEQQHSQQQSAPLHSQSQTRQQTETPNTPQTPTLMVSSQTNSPITNNNLMCEICKQEFANVIQLQSHRFSVHCPQATSLHALLPGVGVTSAHMQTMAALSASEMRLLAQSHTPVSVASHIDVAHNSNFTAEKLREMGVINADAFCEICCKEFCNKYFLRTHKINKHGLSVDGTSSTKSQSGQISDRDRQGEDSNNMSPNCNNDDSYLEPGQRDPASYTNGSEFFNSTMNFELQCEICNRPFASHYLLKMHKFYSHNIPYIKEEDIRKSMASSPGASSEVPNESSIKNCSDSIQQLTLQRLQNQLNSGNGETGQLYEESNTDQASQDLQKLQTMIKELNSSTYLDKATCNLCRQEFENKYFLRVHMMNEHGVILSDDTSHSLDSQTFMRTLFDPTKMAFPQGLQHSVGNAASIAAVNAATAALNASSGAASSDSSEAFCDICHKEFCSKYFLKTHKQNIHGIFESPDTPTDTTPPSFPQQQQSPHQFIQHRKSEEAVNLAMSPNKNKTISSSQAIALIANKQLSQPVLQTSQLLTSDGKPRNITGRNYCNICNKELCNKYFMKTHMLKMHGINIDEHPVEAASNSTIGGVTCDICQKELCSKYFLKVHKQNTHGIYEDPPQPKEPKNMDLGTNCLVTSIDRDSQSAVHGIDPNDTNNRYFSHYTEVCPLCERRFKSIKWLKTHMINDHSDIVAMKPTDLSITGPNADLSRLCILCGQTFSDRVALHIHLVKEHRTTTEELGISGNISGMKLAITATDLSLKLESTQSAHSVQQQSHSQQHSQHSQPIPLPLQLAMSVPVTHSTHTHSTYTTHTHSSLSSPQSQSHSIQSMARINGTTSPQTNIGIVSNNNANKTIISIAPTITTTNSINNNTIILSSTSADNNSNANNSNMNNTNSNSNANLINCPTINNTNVTSNTAQSQSQIQSPNTSDREEREIESNHSHSHSHTHSHSHSTILSSSLTNMINKRTGCGTRIYHCSYCNYSTRWLSNLYAHEKRHTRLNTEGDKKFVCRVCHRAYRYNHSLQRHLLNHRSAGLNLKDINTIALLASTSGTLHSTSDKLVGLDAKFSRLLSGSGSSHVNVHRSGLRPAKVKRYRCSKCNKKFRTRDMCLAHIHAFHSDSRRIILSSSSSKLASNKICRCAYCGFATRNYTILKIHINKHHNKIITSSATDLTLFANKDSISPLNLHKTADHDKSNANETQALSLVTNKPESAPSPSDSSSNGSYHDSIAQKTGQQLSGMVSQSQQSLTQQQTQQQQQAQLQCQQQSQLPMTYAMPQSPPHAGSFIMQPFLITQPDSDGSLKNDTFVPSLVYLPVSHKVLQPIRVAFQLTPA